MLRPSWGICIGMVYCLAVAGCGGDLKSKISGKWKVDPQSVKMPSLSSKQRQALVDQIAKKMAADRFEFRSDGSYTFPAFAGPSVSGTWRLEGKTLVVTPKKDNPVATKPSFTVNATGARIHVTMGSKPNAFEVDLVKDS